MVSKTETFNTDKFMKKLITSFLLLCLLMPARPALAWNGAGHMITGAIAYSDLERNDPGALKKTVAILKKHPEYESRWQPMLAKVAEGDRDTLLFMLAAKWPDDIRRNPTYDRPTWHYINIPFKPQGQPDTVVVKQPPDVNILSAIQENLNILNSNISDGEKAIALCWIFHLYGDIHQPLHTSTLFTTQFPEGDRGGTRFYIKPKADRGTISLHSFWDGLLGRADRFQPVRNRATQLRLTNGRSTFPQLRDKDFINWAKEESFPLAVGDGYLNGRLQGGSTKEEGEVLPAGYAQDSQAIAEKQVTLSGYRISDELKQLFRN
ncbi:MAG: hypothetical protein N5P05_004197 (plasmid) [Chroococcopsis gigantea SAG 12.99]|jgi:hypothetical protein|nr:hypothetical protein [Chroococcopsis gigantea SAG 12.99]